MLTFQFNIINVCNRMDYEDDKENEKENKENEKENKESNFDKDVFI